jgi:hypothetical protein
VGIAPGTSFFFTIPGGGTNLSQGISNHWASEPKLSMEDTMKVPVVLLSLVLAGSLFSAVRTGAQDTAETKAAAKEKKWQGHVIRIDKEHSMIDIRGGSAPSNDPRKVAYDTSTEWTKLGKPAQMDEVKEGSFVIILGHVDGKGILHATRVDLRLPR